MAALLARAISLTAFLGFVACADAGTEPSAEVGPRVVREATLVAGDPVPRSEDPVLVVVDADDGHELDVDALESMGTVEVTVFEPFEERDLTFTGVVVDDLFAVLDIAPDDTVRFHALDDYAVTFTAADLLGRSAVLATRQAEAPIAVENGGPIRLVFLASSDVGANPDLWIWSIDRVDVG